MFMTAIDLETSDLSQGRAFYTQTLGLPLRQETVDAITVQAGTTALTFRSSSEPLLLYHFAFTIPFNKWKQAKAWLKARTTLLEGEMKSVSSPRNALLFSLFLIADGIIFAVAYGPHYGGVLPFLFGGGCGLAGCFLSQLRKKKRV